MAFTYDVATARGQVRLLIHDTDEAVAANQLFTDAEIDAFLTLEEQSVKLAAARALEVIAARQAMVLKVIRLLDLQTDGAAVAKALQASAEQLRAEADDDGEFDWAEWVLDSATLGERLTNEALREGS